MMSLIGGLSSTDPEREEYGSLSVLCLLSGTKTDDKGESSFGTVANPETGEIYEGPFWNGIRHGRAATCIQLDGSKYFGSYFNDKRFEGTLITPAYTYSGRFLEESFHGEGRLALSDGTVYMGEFHNGQFHGVGKLVCDEGLYTGDFVFDMREGLGVMRYQNGDCYSGHWVKDLKEGEGNEILNTGEAYQGFWRGGRRNGKGIVTRDDVTKEGTWRAGYPDDSASWKIKFKDGTMYEGDALGTQPHGMGTMRYAGGRGVYTGDFRNGMRHGRGLFVNQFGEVLDGFWEEDEFERFNDDLDTSRDLKDLIKDMVIEEKKEHEDNSDNNGNRHEQNHGSSDKDLSNVGSEQHHNYKNGDLFVGTIDSKGLRQGHGVFTEHKSGATYEGEWKDSKRHGKGVLITSCTKYDGDFVMDKKEGEGTLIVNDLSSYKGQFQGGCFHGKGILCDSNGKVYRGDFENGLKDGLGEENLLDGKFYSGEYKEGKRHGFGTLRKKEGGDIIYSGQWADNRMDGEGVLFENGTKFEGAFVRGQRSGRGSHTLANGTIRKGKWMRDVPISGNWMVTYEDGSIFSGNASIGDGEDPIPNGFGTKKFKNGDLYTGDFVNGRRDGNGLCVFANGDKWDGAWSDDAIGKHDRGILTFKDGTTHKFGHNNSK